MLYSVIRLSDMTPSDLPEGASVALGFFDGLHLGHRAVVSAAATRSPSAVWTIRGDGSFGKGKRLVSCDSEKLSLLRDIGIEYAVLSDFDDIKNLSGEEFFQKVILPLKIKHLTCGRDFSFGKNASSKTDRLAELSSAHNIGLYVADDIEYGGKRVSSTEIKAMIEDGNVKDARFLLSRPYGFSSVVVHGKMLGRTLGYPTVNQKLPEGIVIPERGVYATAVTLEGKLYAGATNIGTCPTVTPGVTDFISETHIMGYSGDVYGKTVRISFLEKLRDEIKFSSVDELREQIEKDSASALDLFDKYIIERN